MNKNIKHLFSALTVIGFLFLAFGSDDDKQKDNEKPKEIVLTEYTFFSGYKFISFNEGGKLLIYQKGSNESYYMGCVAYAAWTKEEKKIIIKAIKSSCPTENYSDIAGTYDLKDGALYGTKYTFYICDKCPKIYNSN